MKRRSLLVCVCGVLLLMALAGCRMTAGHTDTTKEENTMPFTDRQLDILYAQGMSDEEIKELEEGGMSYRQEKLLELAETLLDALDEKYGETFFMTGAALKGLTEQQDYIMAVSQSHPEEPFRATLTDGVCYDEYYGLISRSKVADYLGGLLAPLLGDCRIDVGLSGTFGPEFSPDLSVEQAIETLHASQRALELSGNIYLPVSGGTNAAFMDLAARVTALLEEQSLDGKLTLYELAAEFPSHGDAGSADGLEKVPSLWHEYIVVFAR